MNSYYSAWFAPDFSHGNTFSVFCLESVLNVTYAVQAVAILVNFTFLVHAALPTLARKISYWRKRGGFKSGKQEVEPTRLCQSFFLRKIPNFNLNSWKTNPLVNDFNHTDFVCSWWFDCIQHHFVVQLYLAKYPSYLLQMPVPWWSQFYFCVGNGYRIGEDTINTKSLK